MMPNIPKYDDLDRYNAELYKLIDHIASGAPNHFIVYAPSGGIWSGSDYQEALKQLNAITEAGYSYIALATRIGTACAIGAKEIKNDSADSVPHV